MKNEIAKKAQKLLQSKKQLKDEFNLVVAERDALQVQIASQDKVDLVKQLQARIAELERARTEEVSPPPSAKAHDEGLATKVAQLTAQNQELESKVAELSSRPEAPVPLTNSVTTGEVHYVIALKDAEEMTKRIKKLQSELWNLEIKHQQLQELHSKCDILPTKIEMSSDETGRLRDALKKERDVNLLMQMRYKDLNDAVLALKETVTAAAAKDPDNKTLLAVLAVTKKALPPTPASDAKRATADPGRDASPSPASPSRSPDAAGGGSASSPTLSVSQGVAAPRLSVAKDPLKAAQAATPKKDEPRKSTKK